MTTVESASDALRMRDNGVTLDAIISDIEMPEMDGFELAREIRGDARWRSVPMVALSGHASEADFQKGREVGFNDYVAKFDREALVPSLAHAVALAVKENAS
ncbi:MAG: response regulator [Rhodospirillaceae bacterium]